MLTPQSEAPELAKSLGLYRLYFKREDLHPYGSHKGRSIPLMIDIKSRDGTSNFAISSSGNAALSAIRYIQEKNKSGANLHLTVITGENIDPDKKRLLQSEVHDKNVRIMESRRPLQSLFERIKDEQATSLRQSNDPDALIGYSALAQEIAGTPDLSAVFIGASSGTAAQGIAEYFIKHGKSASVHIVQTTENSALVSKYGQGEIKEKSIADAIVDKLGYRQDAIHEALERTHGSGWIATNEEIKDAQALLKQKAGIEATANGALGFAGLLKALKKGFQFEGSVVCVITGK